MIFELTTFFLEKGRTDHLKEIEKSSVAISFAHVYKDFNRKIGKLCKEGQLLVEFTTVVEEVREGVSISSLINF
jgi:hypothetical protein